MRTCTFLLGLAAGAVPVGSASAAIITNVIASTNIGATAEPIDRIVDGSGLSEPHSFQATHDDQSVNRWMSGLGTIAGNITFDLRGTYLLDKVAI